MKCTYCNKEINMLQEKCSWYGLDGDFIHDNCKKAQDDKVDKICKMSDEEFESYISK